jgi:hypothetical protein
MFPAFNISIKRAKAIDVEKYEKWLNGLPEGWIDEFVEEGLQLFLKKHGYVLGFNSEMRAKIIKYCLYGHVKRPHDYLEYLHCAHHGGEEEYEWYLDSISLDDWASFMNEWKADEFLDDSDGGYKQRLFLPQIVWNCISLDSSKQHHKWLKTIYDEEETEEQFQNDDNQAYGGDRRTY